LVGADVKLWKESFWGFAKENFIGEIAVILFKSIF